MSNYLFFDSTSTTKCCEPAVRLVQRFLSEDFGNPASNHIFGQRAARALKAARLFFANEFKVEPDQIIFTGSGTEANNLAIYGVVTQLLAQRNKAQPAPTPTDLRVLTSRMEHPSVRKTFESLSAFGVESDWIPVNEEGQLREEEFERLLTPKTAFLSIQQVNNIVGTILPIEKLARKAKEKLPHLVIHTDSIQALGKIELPRFPSSIDLVSISGHKIQGPKGVGALIILNKALIKGKLRPLIWGGEQENGFRSGTPNVGLIAGFHIAAELALNRQKESFEYVNGLRKRFRDLLSSSAAHGKIKWNSPDQAVPHIISLSVPGLPAAPLAKFLEERKCLVSVGSACSSRKSEPNPVLSSMGFPPQIQNSTIRISLSDQIRMEDLETLVHALEESIVQMSQLLGIR